MFRRLRQVQVSLATKCQIGFGAAVVLIIGSALFVPWHRMDDLMNQLNIRAAYTVAEQAILDHAATETHPAPDLMPSTQPAPTTLPAASATTQPTTELLDYQPPLLAWPLPDAPGLNHFERHAIRHFLDYPDSNIYPQDYLSPNGQSRYRYARRLVAEESCVKCHASGDPHFLGIVSVDIQSQVDASQIQMNRLFIFLAGLLAGSMAIAVFYFITTRIILQPVRVLQETAEKVSQGDLNIRSDISTGDEFQQLAETFNTMLANLKASDDQLRLLNKNLDLRLGQLAESNVALYESNRLKSEFLANVSHELRTPLNSILGFAGLLRENLENQGPDSKPVRYLQNILTSGKNLLDLINDLLDLAKIEAGKMEVRSEPLSLADLFEGLAGLLKPLTETKNLSIVATVAADVPVIETDGPKLQQVLYNFMSNAIKFSPPNGRVELDARMESDAAVRIRVSDQGPGIQGDQQEVIFEKFRQVDGGVTRTHGGTGLGLSIARELTLLLGGTIGVQSLPGEGATFWVVIPLKIPPESKDVRARLVLT
ncbi:MAG TPA: ATP-binding protein [Tepidisphaeraceae bacterium]|nr:ATP-binding protein [Tepidisphaeraceae bacterium]